MKDADPDDKRIYKKRKVAEKKENSEDSKEAED